tara:strand:- start:30 stop:563 length:534 start_codon:yes stop_codon:yes gene_type:complete
MTMLHEVVFILSLVLMSVVLFAFAYVAIKARNLQPEYADIQSRSYSIRSKVFWVLVVAGIVITVITTMDLPFAATRGDLADVDRTVKVGGRQWLWEIDQTQANVDETVVFDVSAFDVTHGLGIYDPQMRLVGQTQAMPGYTNSIKITFKESGIYKLLCMEYCGLAHHAMITDFTVVD